MIFAYGPVSSTSAARADTAVPPSSPLVFDGSGTPGDLVVGAEVRYIRVKIATLAESAVITHPLVTAASQTTHSYRGNNAVANAANRRVSIDCFPGYLLVTQSAAASVADGPIDITITVIG